MSESVVTISYQHAGTTPPMFVAGSFTEPSWTPQELDHKESNGEFVFSRTFSIKPGTYQYKFRVAHSEWWVCDDSHETEIDQAGNVNNVLTVNEPRPAVTGQGAEESLSPDHYRISKASLPGIEVKGDLRALRAEEESEERSQPDFSRPNGDLERRDLGQETAPAKDGIMDHQMKRISSSSLNNKPTQKDTNTTTTTTNPTSRKHISLDAKDPDADEKSLSQKSSVSPIPADGIEEYMKDIWLIRFCRAVYKGLVGSMSSMLCGKRRKLFVVALTALIIPVVAWMRS